MTLALTQRKWSYRKRMGLVIDIFLNSFGIPGTLDSAWHK